MWHDFFESIPAKFLPLFENAEHLWDPLRRLSDFLAQNRGGENKGMIKGQAYIEGDVEIGEGTVIEHGAVIYGPTIIGKNCQIRSGAYIRGNVIVGDNSVIGHTTEVIRAIIMDGVHLDHFSYVGDSILGSDAHFGAGAKVANLRFDNKNIMIGDQDTGRKKLGTVCGDRSQLGVNVSIGPGVFFKKDSWLTLPHLLKAGVYGKDDLRDFMKKL